MQTVAIILYPLMKKTGKSFWVNCSGVLLSEPGTTESMHTSPFAEMWRKHLWAHVREWLDSMMKNMGIEAEKAEYVAKKHAGQTH